MPTPHITIALIAAATTLITPQLKHAENRAVNTVHAAQRNLHQPKVAFAHNYSQANLRKWQSRAAMWHARVLAHRRAQAQTVPAWFAGDMICIGIHEEGGHNSIAGFYGFVFSPSTYLSPAPAIAAQYGNSWLSIPQSQQLRVAYALYQAYGWSPWSTAPGCGL